MNIIHQLKWRGECLVVVKEQCFLKRVLNEHWLPSAEGW